MLCNQKAMNILGILGGFTILLSIFIVQFGWGELPCPLCLLQRIAVILIIVGFLLNIRYGIHPIHYLFSILASILLGTLSIRQILLHINSAHGYGLTILGLHLYTWCFLISVAYMAFIGVIASLPQIPFGTISVFTPENFHPRYKGSLPLSNPFIIITLVFCLANIISLLFQSGLHAVSDNPIQYLY